MSSLRRYVKTERNWRSAVWNRWLVSYLTPKSAEDSCAEEAASAAASSAACVAASGPEPVANGVPPAAAAAPAVSVPSVKAAARERTSAPPPSSEDFADSADAAVTAEQWAYRRRLVTRARLEALNDQLGHVQDSIDALTDRLERERLREQRRSQRFEQLLENTAGSTERHVAILEGMLERLERLERRVGLVAASVLPPARAESVAPKPSYFRGSNAPARIEDEESPPESGPHGRGMPEPPAYRPDDPSISGTLSEISLATILSMFELEQRTGRLSLTCRSLPRVSFDLLDGVVVGSLINDEEVDPVGALQRALEWQDGRFTFSHGAVAASNTHARSVGSLLLEATRRNDEAVR